MSKQRIKRIKANIGTAVQIPKWVKAMIFGDSGAGKTYSLATAPKPMLVINVDDSIATLPFDDQIHIYPAPQDGHPVRSWQEFKDVLTWYEMEGYEDYETLAIDSITEAGHLLQEYILGQEGPTKRFHDRMFSQSDYGLFAELMLDEIRRIRDFKSNVILTAQCRDDDVDKPEGGRERWRYPDLGAGKKSGPKTIPHMDLVGYLEAQEDDEEGIYRTLLVQPIRNRKSKIRTRSDKEAPRGFKNPDLTKIFEYIHKEDE